MGVDYAQGFHIGRPAPTHEIAARAAVVSHEPAGTPDRIALVRSVFDGFVRRDLDGIQAYLQPDVELRPIGTAKRAGRTAPYRGYADIRRYLHDVSEVWDTLEIRPAVFQLIEDGVAVFGEVITQSEDGPVTRGRGVGLEAPGRPGLLDSGLSELKAAAALVEAR